MALNWVDLSADYNDLLKPLFPVLQPQGFSRTSMTLSEALCLIILVQSVCPETIFEFGTFYGETSRMLVANNPRQDCKLYTLDIDSTDGIRFVGPDGIVAEESIQHQPTFADPRIIQLKGDSLHFDPQPYAGKMQYIFIDGNHALEYVAKDTENAFVMLDKSQPACIIWHDYENAEFPDVTDYVNALAEELLIIHPHRPDHTTLAVYLSNAQSLRKPD